jgi:hypothetical protein
MTKTKFLALFTALALLVSLPVAALAQTPPVLPHQFAGTAMVGEEMAMDGTMVVAMLDGETVGNTMVMDGKYSLAVMLEDLPTDDTITFMVGEMAAMETAMFTQGGIAMLDLTSEAMMMPDSTPDPMLMGEKGDDGAKGAKGATGPAGPKGDAGAKGDKGDAGAAGAKGAEGAAGAGGATGPSGAAGAAGAQGPMGDAGAAGATGADGATGPSGGGLLSIIALIVGIVALAAAGGAFLAGRRS